jgi:DNA polymerase III subunit alpha
VDRESAVLEPHNMTIDADRLFIDNIEELPGRGGVRVLD